MVAIFKKMSDVMKDIKAVTKDQKNLQQGFKFRGIDQFVNALYPALTKHGVFMTPRATSFTQELKDVTRSSGKPGVDKHVHIMMEYDFFAEDGSKVTVGPIPAEGLDTGDKATNKALSAALKYALIQTFSVPTEDMAEADLDTPEIGVQAKAVVKEPQEAAPKTQPTETKALPPVVAEVKTESVAVVPAPAQETSPKRASFKKPAPKAEAPKAEPATSDDGWEQV